MASVLVAFVALIVVVEPLGVIPLFLSLTRTRPTEDVRRIARRASIVGALVLLCFALFGRAILSSLGIPLDAFRVAGGLVLLLAALDMIRQKNSCRCSPVESNGAGDDVAIVPLAIPLLSGPGSMAAVMSLVGREPTAAVVVAIALVFWVTYLVLRVSCIASSGPRPSPSSSACWASSSPRCRSIRSSPASLACSVPDSRRRTSQQERGRPFACTNHESTSCSCA